MNRAAIIVAALAAAGVLGGCGQAPTAASPSTSSQAPATSRAPATSSQAPAPNTRAITVTVRGGQLSGDTGRVQVPLGSPVTLTVRSDVADEVHLHGYDKEAEIPAGGSASISFTADISGVFEVELHKSELQLLQLQVS